MLAIFGNETAGRVLLYVQNYGEGHARAIAQTVNYHGKLSRYWAF